MKLVVIESPLSPRNGCSLEENIAFARACMRDSLMRGEAPYASHLLYAQEGILDDDKPHERFLGMEAGFKWGEQAEWVAVYIDLGISSGMREGIKRAMQRKAVVEERTLGWKRWAERVPVK